MADGHRLCLRRLVLTQFMIADGNRLCLRRFVTRTGEAQDGFAAGLNEQRKLFINPGGLNGTALNEQRKLFINPGGLNGAALNLSYALINHVDHHE